MYVLRPVDSVPIPDGAEPQKLHSGENANDTAKDTVQQSASVESALQPSPTPTYLFSFFLCLLESSYNVLLTTNKEVTEDNVVLLQQQESLKNLINHQNKHIALLERKIEEWISSTKPSVKKQLSKISIHKAAAGKQKATDKTVQAMSFWTRGSCSRKINNAKKQTVSNNKSDAIYIQDAACIATGGVEKGVKDTTLSSEDFDLEQRGEKGEDNTNTLVAAMADMVLGEGKTVAAGPIQSSVLRL